MVKNVRHVDSEMEKFTVKYTSNAHNIREMVFAYINTLVGTHPIDFLHLCMRFARAFISNSSSPYFTHAFAN